MPANGQQGHRKNRKQGRNDGRPKEMKFGRLGSITRLVTSLIVVLQLCIQA